MCDDLARDHKLRRILPRASKNSHTHTHASLINYSMSSRFFPSMRYTRQHAVNSRSVIFTGSKTTKSSMLSNEDRGPLVDIVIWLVTLLSTTFMALRLYCKFSRKTALWWDDHFLLASWVSYIPQGTPDPHWKRHTSRSIAFLLLLSTPNELFLTMNVKACLVGSNVIISINVIYGFGRPTNGIPPSNLPTLSLLGLISATLSTFGLIWSKTSFAITLLRVFESRWRWAICFVMITSNLFFGASAAVGWLQCVSGCPMDISPVNTCDLVVISRSFAASADSQWTPGPDR